MRAYIFLFLSVLLAGYTPLGEEVEAALEANRIAFQKTPLRKYYRPDDMISFYREIGRQKEYY